MGLKGFKRVLEKLDSAELKSDQNGIESVLLKALTSLVFPVKIRPNWD